MELDETINFFNNYIMGKNLSDQELQNVFSDCLFRYINRYETKNQMELIDCIKNFHKSNHCVKRFDQIKENIILPNINENNKLLLIKSVYYEQLKNVSDTQQDHYYTPTT